MSATTAPLRSSYVGSTRSAINLSSSTSAFLNNTVRFVKILNDFSNAAPWTPLRATCSIALTILECIQTTFKVKEDYIYLGQRIAELVTGICMECQRQWDAKREISPSVEEKIQILLGHLTEIRSFVHKKAKTKFFLRFLKSQELKDSLHLCNKRLDDASRLFDVTSMISIQQTLEAIQIASSSKSTDRLELSHSHIRRDYSLRTSQKHSISRGECFRERQGWVKAIVKSYPSSRDRTFEQEVRFARKIKHPNLHELFGYYSEDDEDIVVYSDYEFLSVQLYLDQELQCGNPFTNFSVVAQMLQGIASGLQYLRFHSPLTKVELEECGKVKNCVIGSNGNIIIGHNLIVEDDRKGPQSVYKNSDEWLKEMFYMIGSELIYGPVEPDWTDWDWVTASRCSNGELTRHTRILENVFCFLQPTFTSLVEDLEKIADSLRSFVPSNSRDNKERMFNKNNKVPLEFQRVRDVLLEIRDGQIYYIYRPPVPFDVRVLDVGYIRPSDGKFVRIDSYRGHLKLGPIVRPPPILVGAENYETSRVPEREGMVRHRFHRPNYATARRMTACEAMPDTETLKAWRFFAKDARRLMEEHRPAHPGVEIQDLILITKIETDLRFSKLAWDADEGGTLEPPPTVQYVDFYEYEQVEFGKPWGYWVIDNAQGDEWAGTTIKETRCAQNIMFLQLEAADLAPEARR